MHAGSTKQSAVCVFVLQTEDGKKTHSEFPAGRWDQVLARRICTECGGDKQCSICKRRDSSNFFSLEEWMKAEGDRRCKECVPRRCRICRKLKVSGAFSMEQWKLGDSRGCCAACEKRRCTKCHKEKGRGAFELRVWSLPLAVPEAPCKQCNQDDKKIGFWTCIGASCKQQYPKEDFKLARERYGEKKLKAGSTYKVCDACMKERQAAERAIAKSSAEHVAKYRKTGQ